MAMLSLNRIRMAIFIKVNLRDPIVFPEPKSAGMLYNPPTIMVRLLSMIITNLREIMLKNIPTKTVMDIE
jgi:hypothetical protein